MTTDQNKSANPVAFLPGFWALIALGGLLGLALCQRTGDIFMQRMYFIFGTFAAGFAWAFIFIQFCELAGEALAIIRNPIPESLDVADRAAIAEQIGKLKGRNHVTLRIRNLLQAWAGNWEPRALTDLAVFQSHAVSKPLMLGGFFGVILLIVAQFLYADPWLTWGGLAILALALFARQNLHTHVDNYIETRLLARLPGNIPHTAMTAADLADALGEKIRLAFRESVPQPEKTADAIQGAVEHVVRRVSDEVEKLQQVLIQGQSALVDRWMHAAEATTSDLKNVETALSTTVNALTGGLSTNAEKMNSMFGGHTKDIDKAFSGSIEKLQHALKEHAELVKSSGGDWGGKVKEVLAEHVNRIEATNHELADQLAKVAALEKNIENVLHIQQVVDGTLKTVAASEEFSKLVSALREHLAASDTLLREISKPRTIRLVETEGEIVEAEVQSAPPPAPAKKTQPGR